MRKIRRLLVAAAATTTLAVGLAFPTTGAAQAQPPKTFTWNTVRSGDCTMFQNAKWILYPDGSAKFDATVTSSDNNDAWLMWPHIQDANKADLGTLINFDVQNRNDWTEFVQNLPDHTERYRWTGHGRFDASLFSLIKYMRLHNHC
ncbi:DUF6294 family protein [Streptomyces klenkii]|uniref:DUF6294 family protein n=1 Tax=Streptomyces klenkii TaxID=1420899 RepID=UPI0036E504D0